MKNVTIFLYVFMIFIANAINIIGCKKNPPIADHSNSSQNNITLASIFGSGMVLQQNTQVNLWGWGPTNKSVSINASWGQTATAIADASGKWTAKLQTPIAISGENQTKYTLTFAGKNDTIILTNILIGDVYL